jgi:hypothetical protein
MSWHAASCNTLRREGGGGGGTRVNNEKYRRPGQPRSIADPLPVYEIGSGGRLPAIEKAVKPAEAGAKPG